MNMRACLPSRLLCQQVNHIELLESGEDRNNDGRRNNGPDHGNRDIPRPVRPIRSLQQGTLIKASVHALQGTVNDSYHKRQRQPQIYNRTAHKGKPVPRQPAYRLHPQFPKPLIQKPELRIKHPRLPEQNGNISGHRPWKNQQRFINIAKPQSRKIQ